MTSGLDICELGRPQLPHSPGESASVRKLASHLAQATSRGTLYICDEPTTGLHFDDIAKLLAAFERVIENGGSLLIIEHNLERDPRRWNWIIDLEPEARRKPKIVDRDRAASRHVLPPCAESHTGKYA